MKEARIITYEPRHKQAFIDLNTEWLQKYFTVEPHDKQVFQNIEEVVLAPGGEIFFCNYDDAIVGTVAMQRIDEKRFELIKMAVTEAYQGMGFSNLLMQACLRFAKENKASAIIILSNRSLQFALALYTKFGFVEVPLSETDYSRADIQMELQLT